MKKKKKKKRWKLIIELYGNGDRIGVCVAGGGS
jgi:hypothetical protein